MCSLQKCLMATVVLLIAAYAISFASSNRPAPAATKPAPASLQVTWRDGRLSVNSEQAPLSQILSEISRQTGLEIRGGAGLDRKVDAHISGVSLREGLDRLLGSISYALLETEPSVKPSHLALILMPQGSTGSKNTGHHSSPVLAASIGHASLQEGQSSYVEAQTGLRTGQSQTGQAATPSVPVDTNKPLMKQPLIGNADDSHQSGADANAKLPPPVADDGVNLASNQPAPAAVPDEGYTSTVNRPGPTQIPDAGANLEQMGPHGGEAPAEK